MKCLKCGGHIDNCERCESEFSGHKHTDYWVGTCANCGTIHQWEEIFISTGIDDLRIVDYSENGGV
jgi:hypothetical protein